MSKKRGSLELSINAIVIIVLAFVLLGLGLGFIRNQFKSMSGTTAQVQEQVKQQILEDLRTGDKKLSFPSTRVQIDKGGLNDLAVGIKNTKPSGEMHFYLDVFVSKDQLNNIKCTKIPGADAEAFDGLAVTCDTTQSTATDAVGEDGQVKDLSFFWQSGPYTLGVADSEVYPISVQETGKQSDTYMVNIVVWECSDDDCTGILKAPYAEKNFFVQVG